ncbi:MFS general substrate transporter [Dacryopinax primogenitus]|uniref:MFS general substrate transporter n=1 Tax=Dacryopinax primogenitus (strain DJM 731) TaxID=1858805 RepID=M5GF48_DACPD|nr:MFS general substrate transporter [Dacryopinax primogenitus]EJU05967.1 MFS general substrate transporter [Dacryopinax primogenitus]
MSEPFEKSSRRWASFVGSVLSAVGAGTNYAYSAYAPQLGNRLHLSSTTLNIIGAAGNLGVYLSGPFWGYIVDKRGPSLPLLLASLFLLLGYLGIRLAYDGVLVLHGGWELGMLALFGFCTGGGGNAGLTSAVNATAKSFHDKTRASATAIVLSGFGLSAFVFSTLAATLFPGETSAFLLTLALGTSTSMLIGYFTVKPVPPHHQALEEPPYAREHVHERGHEEQGFEPMVSDGEEASEEQLEELSDVYDLEEPTSATSASALLERTEGRSASFELSPTRSMSPVGETHRRLLHPPRPGMGRGSRSRSSRRDAVQGSVDLKPAEMALDVDIHGRELLLNMDFWMLFIILSCLSGTGLMWINNVGSVAQALWRYNHPDDPDGYSKLQAAQVSIVSIFNCLGRILIGVSSDVSQHHLGAKRSYLLSFVALSFIVSQLVAARISYATHLWVASMLLGLSYGSVFGIMPMVSLEWFGMGHFSQNWGFLALSPLFGGNLFNLFFGRNYDSHSRPVAVGATPDHSTLASVSPTGSTAASLMHLAARAGGVSDPHKQCFDGRLCYVDSLTLTTVACCLAFVLSFWAAWRDMRRSVRRGEGWVSIGEGGSK